MFGSLRAFSRVRSGLWRLFETPLQRCLHSREIENVGCSTKSIIVQCFTATAVRLNFFFSFHQDDGLASATLTLRDLERVTKSLFENVHAEMISENNG